LNILTRFTSGPVPDTIPGVSSQARQTQNLSGMLVIFGTENTQKLRDMYSKQTNRAPAGRRTGIKTSHFSAKDLTQLAGKTEGGNTTSRFQI